MASLNLTTPVGRLVQGDLYTITKPPVQAGQAPKLNKDGTPQESYYVALAVPKNSPEWNEFYGPYYNFARQCYPQYFDATTGAMLRADFALKISDGDGRDKNGKLNSEKEGWTGCWIIRCENGFAPKVLIYNEAFGSWSESTAGKMGDYARLAVSIKPNNSQQTPGMYVNLSQVAIEGIGSAISFGPSADEAFGKPKGPPPGAAAPGAPPAGAVPGNPPLPGGAPVASPPPPAAGQPPLPIASPSSPPPPASGAPPYPGFMPDAGAPLPPPPAPPVVAGPVMTAKAGAYTYESFTSKGWTHEQLVAQGYVNP